MNDLIERVKQAFLNLNERERILVAALGVILAVGILGLPLMLMHNGNTELEAENQELRDVLSRIADKAPEYAQYAEAKAQAARLYANKTPPLGSFLEAEARKHGLTVKEVNDQPEKTVGTYQRRSVSASFPGVGLSPALQLMSGIVSAPHPVAIEMVQLEHYQSGDKYNIKIGVLTFDKKKGKPKDDAEDSD